jgi:hypothetical protein
VTMTDFCRGQRTTRVGEAHTPAPRAPVTDMEDAARNDQLWMCRRPVGPRNIKWLRYAQTLPRPPTISISC